MSKLVRHLYEFGPFRLDAKERLLLRDGEPVPLTPKAFDTLLVLVQHSGCLLEKEELMQTIWPDTVVEENNLNRNISMLRKVLGEDPNEPQYIETVPKHGFRFVARVKEVQDEGADLIVQEHTRSWVVIEEGEESGEGEKGRRGDQVSQPLLTPSLPHPLTHSRFLLIAMLLVGLMAALSYVWLSQSKPTETSMMVRSIAVLPFKPLSADGSDEYLGLGMADTLITKLSNIRQLIVRPTSAVRKYIAPDQDPLAAGREQQVDAVLEGSIQRAGESIRVTVRLLNVRDGSPLWAYQCDEQQCTNLFAVQESISEEVTRALMLKLTGTERERLTKRYTENTDAYQLYLKGRYFWNKRTSEDLKKAIKSFEQAIDRDPNYALAYAGLADCYNLLSLFGDGFPPKESFPRAKAAATQALEIDAALAEAHASLGFVKQRFDWDWAEAEREFRRAIELNPHYPTAHHWYAFYLAAVGRAHEALTEINRAQELDPVSPIINTDVGVIFLYAHQFDQAIERYREALEMDPNFAHAHSLLRAEYERRGLIEEALTEFLKERTLSGGDENESREEIAALREAYAASGWSGYWQKRLEQLKEQSKQRYVPPFNLARIYALLGQKDQALAWLQKAYEERSALLCDLKVVPAFDGLHGDPKFQDLLRRVRLQ